MSWMLSTSSLLRPATPTWLENICQQLTDNDPAYKTVELIHPRMDDGNAKVFAKALSENYTVTALILSCYSIVDDGTAAIGQVLSQNTTITKIQFRDLRDVREITTLVKYLQPNRTITDVSFRHCTICPRSATAMAQYLKHTNRIRELRITDSNFIGNALQIICQNGLCSHPSIQRLYFINDDIEGTDSSDYLSNIVDDNNTLQELHLGENNIGDIGVASIVRSIIEYHSTTVLHHIDLRSNNITCTGAMSIQGLLVRNIPTLRTINLSNNELCDHGMMAICRGLQQSTTIDKEFECRLRTLDVNTNQITSRCATSIGSMLRMNRTLQDLNISFNQLCDDGVLPIVSALQSNRSLRKLNLRRNNITNVGAQHIANGLPHMRGLKELFLSKNYDIDTTGMTSLLKGLQANVELEYLQVDDNSNHSYNEPIQSSSFQGSSSSTITTTPGSNIYSEIVRYTKLNKAGRRIFRSMNTIPRPLWSYVYTRINHEADMLFYFIKSNPDLFAMPALTATEAMDDDKDTKFSKNQNKNVKSVIPPPPEYCKKHPKNSCSSPKVDPSSIKTTRTKSKSIVLQHELHDDTNQHQQRQNTPMIYSSNAFEEFPIPLSSPKRKKKKHCENAIDISQDILMIRTSATF